MVPSIEAARVSTAYKKQGEIDIKLARCRGEIDKHNKRIAEKNPRKGI